MIASSLSVEEKQVPTSVSWPEKVDVFGVGLSNTNYDDAAETIVSAASLGQSGVVSCFAAHPLVMASCDLEFRERVNKFDMITPDGQPVRWAMNALHRVGMKERVYGPELTLRVCRLAAKKGVSIYLYGGSPTVVEKFRANLVAMCPDLKIAGFESPPYRPLSDEEDERVVKRINDSGAGIVLIGLGCPKQDLFAAEHQTQIQAVQLCVGAAFDFHAGVKKTAPAWMQRRGLEWLFRLIEEPHRLWRRYLVTNTIFVAKLAAAMVSRKR